MPTCQGFTTRPSRVSTVDLPCFAQAREGSKFCFRHARRCAHIRYYGTKQRPRQTKCKERIGDDETFCTYHQKEA